MECGKNSVEVTPTGVTIVTPVPDPVPLGGEVEPSTVQIDADGFIKLG